MRRHGYESSVLLSKDMRRKNEGKGRERKEGDSKPEIVEKGPCQSHPGEAPFSRRVLTRKLSIVLFIRDSFVHRPESGEWSLMASLD